MGIATTFSDFVVSSRTSWADLAAYCYANIDGLDALEAEFLSRYCHAAPSHDPNALENPNLSALQRLARGVSQIASRDMLLHEGPRADALTCVANLVGSIKLEPYGDPACNEATLHWAVITGIDMAYADAFRSMHLRRRGPLNKECFSGEYGVYLRPLDGSIMQRYREAGISRIPNDDLNSQLGALIILKHRKDRRPPEIRLAHGVRYRNDDGVESLSVRIGLCLFCAAELFSFERADLPMRARFLGGKDYAVEYASDYAERFTGIALRAVDLAIEKSCDVLVFPEYVMPPECQRVVSERLKAIEDKGRLSLVVAGSGRTEDGNNVCVMYDSRGRELGRYYKYSSYIDSRGCFRESLSNPGLECTLVDIEGLGRVLPAICKDLVSDDRYTLDIAHDLHPQLICAPAFSDSLERGFSDPLRNAAERSLSIGCVCNCCGARQAKKDGSVEATIICVPQRKLADGERTSKQALAEPATISCSIDCRNRCLDAFNSGSANGCLKTVDIAFADAEAVGSWPCVTIE